MYKPVFSFIWFYFLGAFLVSGQATISPDNPKAITGRYHTIWLNSGQLLRKEIQVLYERNFTDRLAAEVGLGYKFATHTGKQYHNESPSLYSPEHFHYVERMHFSKGFLSSFALKIYPKGAPGFYVSAGGFYRYRFYRHQLLSNAELDAFGNENWNSKQSMDLHVYGAKILLGHTLDLGAAGNKARWVGDFFYGMSYRRKSATTAYDWKISTAGGSNAGNPNPPVLPPANYINPSPGKEKAVSEDFAPQLGFKLGIEF